MEMKDANGKFDPAILDYVRRGSVELMQSLLRNDDPNLIDQEGKTLLHYAAESNNFSMTQHLINNNQDVDIIDNHGNSPLMLSLKNNSNFDIAKLLIEAGANIYSCNDEAASPLLNGTNFKSVYSQSSSYHEYVKAILQRLKKDCCNDEQLLLKRLRDFDCSLAQAISLGDGNLTRLMLNNGYSVDERDLPGNGTALHRAVYLGDLENVKVLLEFNASIDAQDQNEYPPLYRLFDKTPDFGEDDQQSVEIMKILIELGALSSKAPTDPILYILGCSKSLDAVTFLAKRGVDFNNHAALSALIENPCDDSLEVLRGKKIDVNSPGEFSLISHAICWGRPSKVQFLLEHGADPNAVNVDDGTTPLINAFFEQKDDVELNIVEYVQLLLRYGADAQFVYESIYTGAHITVFDLESDISFQQQALKSVIAHLALIESCGETISNLIHGKIESRDIYKQYSENCKQQIEQMKKTAINGNCTLYKLLTESHTVITRYARNQEFTVRFEETMKNMRFVDPYYSISLHERVGKAIQEARLRAEAFNVMNKILPCRFKNYTDIIVEILDYLTSDDLKNICKVYDNSSPDLST